MSDSKLRDLPPFLAPPLPPLIKGGMFPAAVDRALPRELFQLPVNLDGGEVVLLAIKPSAWFVLFDAAPWLLGALLAVGMLGWTHVVVSWVSTATLVQAALALGMLRLGLAVLRWASRFYVLTNRRVMRIQGIVKVDVFACPLLNIRTTRVTVEPHERLVRLGTLRFNIDPPVAEDGSWTLIRHPEEVHAEVRKAIQRAIDHS